MLIARTATAQDAVPRSAPAVHVVGTPIAGDTLLGDKQQPEWTAYRRFPTTRIYVLPSWQVEFEQWWNLKFPRAETAEDRFLSEVEIGLPYRFQLDIYETYTGRMAKPSTPPGCELLSAREQAPRGNRNELREYN